MLKTPNSWNESLFPELYEKNPKTPLCDKLARGKHNSELILIHHLHQVSIPFIRALAKGYKIRKIIGIPYSSFQSVVNELQKDFDVVVPKSLDEISLIVKKEVESTSKKIIIEEIGGYTVKIAKFLEKQSHVIGIIEDTKQGYWAWKKIPLKRLSVQSVACSELKKAEKCMVAKSIIDGTARFLAVHKLPPLKKQKVLLVGYGDIGAPTAHYLESQCKKLIVFDSDPIKLLVASSEHAITTKISKASLILGITGNPFHAIKTSDLSAIANNTILVSGSSKRVEFDLNGFAKKAKKVSVFQDLQKFYFGDKKIKVANFGEPINLSYSVGPAKALDLVYGTLVDCINRLDNKQVTAGLSEIPEKIQKEIAVQYLKIHNKP